MRAKVPGVGAVAPGLGPLCVKHATTALLPYFQVFFFPFSFPLEGCRTYVLCISDSIFVQQLAQNIVGGATFLHLSFISFVSEEPQVGTK